MSSFRMSEFVIRMYTNDDLSHQLKILTERFVFGSFTPSKYEKAL